MPLIKKEFYFLITYFKPSGKYYTGVVVKWEIACCDSDSKLAYYYDAVAKLRGLRDCGGQGSMPGLCGDGWDGPILIEQAKPLPRTDPTKLRVDDFVADGVPHLILPRS